MASQLEQARATSCFSSIPAFYRLLRESFCVYTRCLSSFHFRRFLSLFSFSLFNSLFSPPLPFSTSVCSRFESNFHPPFFAGKSAERNFRWLIIFFHQFGSEELLDDYRYVRSSARKRCHHRWFFSSFPLSLCNMIFHPRRRYRYIDSRL